MTPNNEHTEPKIDEKLDERESGTTEQTPDQPKDPSAQIPTTNQPSDESSQIHYAPNYHGAPPRPQQNDAPFDPRGSASQNTNNWKQSEGNGPSFGPNGPRIAPRSWKIGAVGWILLGFFLGIFVLPIVFIFSPRTPGARVSALRYCLIGMIISFVLEFILLQVFGMQILDPSYMDTLMGTQKPQTSVF